MVSSKRNDDSNPPHDHDHNNNNSNNNSVLKSGKPQYNNNNNNAVVHTPIPSVDETTELEQQQKQQNDISLVKRYKTTIYSYTCYGLYHAHAGLKPVVLTEKDFVRHEPPGKEKNQSNETSTTTSTSTQQQLGTQLQSLATKATSSVNSYLYSDNKKMKNHEEKKNDLTIVANNNNNNNPESSSNRKNLLLNYNNNNFGTCHGYRSELKLLADFGECQRKVALKTFEEFHHYFPDAHQNDNIVYDNEDLFEASLHHGLITTTTTNNDNQDDNDETSLPATGALRKTLVFKSNQNNNNNNNNKENDDVIVDHVLEDDWTNYGVTRVSYLSLADTTTQATTTTPMTTPTPTQHREMVAVAPNNTGLSIRKVDSKSGLQVTQIQSGPVLMHMESISSSSSSTENPLDQNNVQDSIITKQQSATTTTSYIHSLPDFLQIQYKYSTAIMQHIHTNVFFLKQYVFDDLRYFTNRQYHHGIGILKWIPPMTEKTNDYLYQISSHMKKKFMDYVVVSNENNNNDNHHKNNKKRPKE